MIRGFTAQNESAICPVRAAGFTIRRTTSFPGDLFMILRVPVRAMVIALLTIVVSLSSPAREKQKNPDKQSVPSAAPATSAQPGGDKKEDKDEGDPLFKGMNYRSIGPYRGGRSLTAAGIPGDPSNYYFGSTGGGVWKSNDGG